jgi:hypothetical protein
LVTGEGFEASAQAENMILAEVARVLAPVGEELLARAKQLKAELLLVLQTLYALTGEEVAVPLFGGEIARLNARDARMEPLAGLRDQVFRFSLEAAKKDWAVARSAAEPWLRARAALREDADALLPDQPYR